MVPDLALRKTVNPGVGIWATFRHRPTVRKTSSEGDSEQECHLNHRLLSDCLTKNKLEPVSLRFIFSKFLSLYYEPGYFLEIPQRISQWLVTHCHSSHLSTCNLLSFSPVIRLSTCVISVVTTGRMRVGGGALLSLCCHQMHQFSSVREDSVTLTGRP